MNYKPYSAEWSRKRYLAEAIRKYFEDDASPEVVLGDIADIIQEWEQYHTSVLSKTRAILKEL
jgi:hypothetical protein